MTKTGTKTVETAYGTAEFDMVECDSCGQEVPAEDAVDFTIGDREGDACQLCADDGPIDFPEKVYDSLPLEVVPMGIAFWPALVVAVALVYGQEDVAPEAEDFLTLMAVTSAGAVVWTVLAIFGALRLGVVPWPA